MATLFLLVLSVSALSAVRGKVDDDFTECKEFFFNGKKVMNLEIDLSTPKPLTRTEFKEQIPNYLFDPRYETMYHSLQTVINYLQIFKQDESVHDDIKSSLLKLQQINQNIESIKKSLETEWSSWSTTESALQSLKKELEPEWSSWSTIESALQSLKKELDETELVCKSFKSNQKESESAIIGLVQSNVPALKNKIDKILGVKKIIDGKLKQMKMLTEEECKTIDTDLEMTTENQQSCHSANSAANPAYICQKHKGAFHFATLYDRARRIPLYSAYKMDRTGKPGRSGEIVFYEPQLLHTDLEEEQQVLTDITKSINKIEFYRNCPKNYPAYQHEYKLRWSQATDKDFFSFDKGHLNPAGHHAGGEGSEATMTFTNVAPQSHEMNTKFWSKYETRLRIRYGGEFKAKGDENVMKDEKKCENLYVVTGVVPGKEWILGRVNIPSHYWSAHCCTRMDDQNKEVPDLSGGALCPNKDGEQLEEFDRVDKLEKKLQPLFEMLLGKTMNNALKIFDNCVP